MTTDPTSEKKNKISSIEKEENPDATIVPQCPLCSSENVYGISRVVGYFSVIENWNNSKKSELKRRQKGNYWSKE
ncbi:MAG: anaerobic ribonucleoside-triphosphate reductase [Candidatus Heimdallarchaeota archaeon]